ncbi:hypothetical protein CEB3_c50290 [Peptococcaceae bacterium CEB3]|nr:hypothetical protein CEB3_c50290 [Peptococcaceae bacterium CEB3]
MIYLAQRPPSSSGACSFWALPGFPWFSSGLGGPIRVRPRMWCHRIGTVLTVMVVAVLAGARNFREIADRAARLPSELLTLAGLIQRLPHSNHYQLTSDDIRIAVLYAEVHSWLSSRLRQPINPGPTRNPGRATLARSPRHRLHRPSLTESSSLKRDTNVKKAAPKKIASIQQAGSISALTATQ